MTSSRLSQSIISYYDKESSSATEFRRIIANLKLLINDKPRTILVTSAMVGEGKSITSSFLGITAANITQSKVAIVDFDLRKPKIHHYFGLSCRNGLSDVMTGKSNIKSVVKKTVIENLSIVTAGEFKEQPTDIIDQGDILAVMEELKFYYDYIIVDSPPIIPVSDPLLIADKVDGVLVVIKAGVTPREVTSRAINLLNNSGINLLGSILNDYENVLPYYYKDKYYGYSYK
jgi:capsular exopolysaccharide synthesis family protein